MITFRSSEISWQGIEGAERLVEGILSTSKSEVVKASRGKAVTRCRFDGTDYYVKRYQNFEIPFRPLKFFFKPSQARREWATAQVLQKKPIPIVEHVALGERWSRAGLQESILITEAFDGLALRFSSHWLPDQLGEFIDRLHSAGVLHGDLHPANILAHRETGEFRLVDLYQIKIKDALTDEEKKRNKAFLAIHLPLPVSAEVFRLSRQLRWKAMQKRARRCLRENQDFTVRRIGSNLWQVRVAFLMPARESLLRQPDAAFAVDGNILKDGRSSTVVRCDGEAVIKRYNFKKPLSYIKDFFRISRGRRSFLNAYHLEITGVSTARGIATSDCRDRLGRRRSYFVMEDLHRCVHLLAWRGDRLQAIHETAKLIAKLHNEGFSHRDLKATNILVEPDGRAYLIDLDGLEFRGTVIGPKQVAADLHRLFHDGETHLSLSTKEKLAFYRAYGRERHFKPIGARTHMRAWRQTGQGS